MRLGLQQSAEWQRHTGRAVLLVLCLCTAVLHAESPKRKNPAAKKKTVPVGTLNSVLFAPSRLPPEDALYLKLFSATDGSISRQYQDRWSYHEMQIPYAATQWNHEHLSIGSLDFYGRAPYEGDVRHEFASQVLRVRLDSALREYFKNSDGAKTIARAQRTVDQIKNVPVKVGGGSHPGEFHVGYDVLSDASKIEFAQGPWLAGVYHPHLVGSLTGQRPGQNELSLRVTASLTNPLPSASLSYQPGNTLVEAALSRPISRALVGRVVTSTPTVANAAISQYRVEVSYQF